MNALWSAISAQLHERSQEPLLVDSHKTLLTYEQADQLSQRLASVLLQSGAKPGDRVTVQVEKTPQALCLYLGCLRAGLVFHPLNSAYTPSEIQFFVGDAQPAVVVCDPEACKTFEQGLGADGSAAILTLDRHGNGSLMERANGLAPQDYSQPAPEHGSAVEGDKAQAALLYSSGTTGQPKGICLSYQNLASNAKALIELWGFKADDCLLHALPIYHVHGLFVAVHCALLIGARMFWLPHFEAGKAVQALPDCSVMMGVPTYYTRLLAQEDFSADTCERIRLFISGSAPLLSDTFHAFEQRTGHRILERYGMTETGMSTSNPLRGERRPGTVGLPLPDVSLRVVDDEGKETAENTPGHLQVRGPNVFTGYWRLPAKNAEAFTADGFFDTGDTASISSDGYITLVGRSKDMIISGGLNVYPVEIEQVINQLATVKESAVVARPDADFGEVGVAFVVRDGSVTEQEVTDHCREALANFKVPKQIQFLDALPRNAMGKVQKNRLREHLNKSREDR